MQIETSSIFTHVPELQQPIGAAVTYQPIRGTDASDVNNNAEYGMASSSACQDFDDKLINAVRRFRVLYDLTLTEFCNNTVKENAWQSVAREVNSSGLYTVYSDGLGRGFSQNS